MNTALTPLVSLAVLASCASIGCGRNKNPPAEEVCIGQYGPCARLEDGRVACWGVSPPFVFDANAKRVGCAAPRNKQLCVEDKSGQFQCWAADSEWSDQTQESIPPDSALPLESWWVDSYGFGGCGANSDRTLTCWPDDTPFSNQPDYPVQGVAFTRPCLNLIDTDGALHARYETEGCTTLEEPKSYEDPHDAHGLDELPAGSDWSKVAGGTYHACALDSEGRATCWGWYGWDKLEAPTDLRFTELAAGNMATCGITTDGHIHCWGDTEVYDTGTNGWIPDEVPTSDGWVHITMSEDYACAINVEGQVSCFGNYWPPSRLEYALDNPVSEPPTED